MRIIIQILFCLLLFVDAIAQEKKETIELSTGKQHFISMDLGIGLGWREYKNIDNAIVLLNQRPQNGESPGIAGNVAINYGIMKKNGVIRLD